MPSPTSFEAFKAQVDKLASQEPSETPEVSEENSFQSQVDQLATETFGPTPLEATVPGGFKAEQELVEEDPYGKTAVKELEESWFFGAKLPKPEDLEDSSGSIAPSDAPASSEEPLQSIAPLEPLAPVSAGPLGQTKVEPFDPSSDASWKQSPGLVKPIDLDLKKEFQEQQAMELESRSGSPEYVEKTFSQNPKIDILLKALDRLEDSDDSYAQEYKDRIYDALAGVIINESFFPNRPLDAEIAKKKAENIRGFTSAVEEGDSSIRSRNPGMLDMKGRAISQTKGQKFAAGIEGSVDFTEEEYQEHALQKLAMEHGLNFNKLNESLVGSRDRREAEVGFDPMVETRYVEGQVRNIAVDVLNIPVGLAVLALGGAEAAASTQQTGISGELLDPASKAYKNAEDLGEYRSLLQKGGDILTITSAEEMIISGEKPLTKLGALSRISIRGPRNTIEGTSIYVPKALPTDVAVIERGLPGWRMDSLPIIMGNIEASATNKLIEVPVSPRTPFEPMGVATTEEKAEVILTMLEAAMFTEDPEVAMGKFSPLIEGVPLPTSGDTLGNKVSKTLSQATSWLNTPDNYEYSGGLGFITEDRSGIPDSQKAFAEVFVDDKGNSIPKDEVLKYGQEKIESFLSDYATVKLIEDAEKQIKNGYLGSAYYPKDASEELKEFKLKAGSALLVSSYLEALPQFNKTKEEYVKNLLDGAKGIPEDMLLSFIAIDIALRDITEEDNIYTKGQIEAAKEKLENDLAYIVMDLAGVSSLIGSLGKGAVIASRAAKATPKAFKERARTSGRFTMDEATALMMPGRAKELGLTADSFKMMPDGSVMVGGSVLQAIDVVKDIIKVTKEQINAQREKIRLASINATDRENMEAFKGNDSSALGVTQKKESSLIDLEMKRDSLKSDIAENSKKPDRNEAEIARKEKELVTVENELSVREDFLNNRFESLSSRPTKQEPGAPTTSLRDKAPDYREIEKAFKREVEVVKNYDALLKKATAAERAQAAKNSAAAFDRLIKNNLPEMKNWKAPENAPEIASMLQTSHVVDPGIWRHFLSNTRDPIRITDDLVATLIAETKVAMFSEGKDLAAEALKRLTSKEDLAKMSNQTLQEFMTREQAVKAADYLSVNGVENWFAYARLPFLLDEEIRYFIRQAELKKTPSNKKKIIIQRNDDGGLVDSNLEVYGKKADVDPRVNPPMGILKSRFQGIFSGAKPGTKGFGFGGTVASDVAKRWLFGDRAVALASNKEYVYSFLEFMSSPLAFVNIPRATQNFVSESLLYLNTVGKGESFVARFLDNFVTPENRIGSSLYYSLLGLDATKQIDQLAMQRLLSKIPKYGDWAPDRKTALAAFDLTADSALDFAKINASDFDNLIQSMLTKESMAITVNGERIVISDLLRLEVNQTTKLKRDIEKLNIRLSSPNLKSRSPLYRRLKARRDKIQEKINSGDVYVSVDELYGNLPEKRAQLKELEALIQTRPPNMQSLLLQRDKLKSDIMDMSAVTPEEAITGVTDLRWAPKKPLEEMTGTERTVNYIADQFATPVQQDIMGVVSQIMIAADTKILAQKNSAGNKTIVVRNTDKGLVAIKTFEDPATAYDYMKAMNTKAKNTEVARAKQNKSVEESQRLKGYKRDELDDITSDKKAQEIVETRPSEVYEVISPDEVVWGTNEKGTPIIKRAMDIPATNIVPTIARYLSVYVDSGAVAIAAKEMFEHSLTLSPSAQRQLQNSMARRMLYGFENGNALVERYGNPSKALKALLDMTDAEQGAQLGRAFLAQERFYGNQAMGSISTPAELASIRVNARLSIQQTHTGLLTNLQNYRMLNASFMEGGTLTKSQWSALTPRQKKRYIPLSNVTGRTPGATFLDDIDDLYRNRKKKKASTIGSASMDSLFGDGRNLYISREHATTFSDMAGLVELSTRTTSQALSYYKQAKIMSFSSGIMPIQWVSSILFHATMLSKRPGALFNYWTFKEGPSVFADVVRVKTGRKAKNPLVEEVMRRGTVTTGSYLEFTPEAINENLFLVQALSMGEDFVRNPSSNNALESLANKIHDLHINAPNAAQKFVDDFKVVFDEGAGKPLPSSASSLGLNTIKANATGALRTAAGVTQFSYSLLDDFLKTLYAVSLHSRGGIPIGIAVQDAIKVWFNYGDLSRFSNAMRYGTMSPFSSPFIGYLANAAYAFPSVFSDAPLRAAVAGHAAMVHNSAALETIRIFNDINEMRIALGDPLAVPFPLTDVTVGMLSDRYGPGDEQIEDLVSGSQGAGSLKRIDPSPGLAHGLSMIFKDPDSPDFVSHVADGIVTSPILDGLALAAKAGEGLWDAAVELTTGEPPTSGRSAAETDFLAEKKGIETTIEAIENKSGPITKDEEKYITEMTEYISQIARNDFGSTTFRLMRSTVLPVQIADLWSMLPSTGFAFDAAPDRDPTDIRQWLGYKYNVADMTKLQKANVVTNKTVNVLKQRIDALDRANIHGNLSNEVIKENQAAILTLWKEIDSQFNAPDKAKKLESEQIKAANNVRAALFSLYIAGEFDIFLRERTRKISQQ